MKRVGHIYEKMCDINLIKVAIHKSAKGKTQKPHVKQVLEHIDFYANKILEMLLLRKVELSPSRHMRLYDHSCSKERLITIPKYYPDQIIHWVLMLVIEPILSKGMYRWSCGSVPTRGGLEAKKYVERAIKDKKVRYVAKLDIRKFFNNVQPQYLMPMFERKIKDRDVLDLIAKILENGGNCLPIGYYTSQWFSNFFLEQFDHYVKEQLKVKYYVRYVDDMVLIDTNKRKLRKAIVGIREYLKGIGLEIKDNLWKMGTQPIDFVGFRFYQDKILLRKKIYFRLNRRVRVVKKKGYTTLHQARGLLSLIGWLHHINGREFYKKHIYPYTPTRLLKRIISKYQLKENHNERKTIFKAKVACQCQ